MQDVEASMVLLLCGGSLAGEGLHVNYTKAPRPVDSGALQN